MNSIRELFVLLGADKTDSVSPALDGRLALRRVCFLHPCGTRSPAERVVDLITRAGIEANRVELPHPLQMNALRNCLRTIAAACPAGTAALNVSGAPPLAALPACEAFSAAGHAVFAVEPDSDTLIWLSKPDGRDFLPFNVANRLSLADHLSLHGLEWLSARNTLARPDAHLDDSARFLARQSRRNADSVRTLSRLATDAGAKLVTERLPARNGRHEPMQGIVEHLRARGIARLNPNKQLEFAGEAERVFAAGGWFEHYVFMATRELARAGRVQDAALGMQFRLSPSLVSEWDVTLLAENALYVVECKARGPRWTIGGRGTETVHKLDSEGSIQGLVSRSMLATIFPLPDDDAERARLHGVDALCLEETNDLVAALDRWIAGGAVETRHSKSSLP